MKQLVKDLAAFAVADVGVSFVMVVTLFSALMTLGVIERYQTIEFCKEISFWLVVAAVVINVLMDVAATMMVYEDFKAFRANRNNQPA